VLEVLYHCARFGVALISPAAGAAKNVEFLFVCLSVCLSVRHAFERQRLCALLRHEGVGVQKEGRFVVVQPCSTFSDCCQIATPLNAEVQKTAKIVGVFRQQRATE